MESSDNQKSQRKLILLCAVALVPLGFAYVLYYFLEGSEPWASSSKGELLNPIISADTLGIKNNLGDSQKLGESGVWWLVVVSGEFCRTDCENALHLVRGSHVLLNREISRARRAWLRLSRDGISVDKDMAKIVEKYPELKIFTARQGTLKNGVYIVDPLANIVFYYPYSEAGKPLLEDLKKLLKVSRIG